MMLEFVNTAWPVLGPILLLAALAFVVKVGRDLWRDLSADIDEWVIDRHQAVLKEIIDEEL